MKKTLLLSAAVMVASSLMAAENQPVMQARATANSTLLSERHVAGAAPAMSRSAGEAILSTPAGQLTDNMTLSEFALYPRGFEIYQRMVSGKVSAIVEGDDGCLYVKNPVAVYPTDSWLKLEHREGTQYVAHLPQAATAPWEYDGEEVRMNFDRLAFDEDEGYYYPSFTESELTFSYENGVLTSVGEIGEDTDMPVMLGLTYDIYGPEDADEAWAWFGVNNITVKAMDAAPGALPAGVEAAKKVMTYSDGEAHAWVAVDGSNIYLRPGADLGYARGTIADGKATFESGQYLGVSGGSHCYFMGAQGLFIVDEDYYEGGYMVYEPTENLVFDYTPESMTTEGALVINEGTMSFYAKNIYNQPVITDYVSVEAAPQNPVIVRYEEYDDWEEYGVLVFELPAMSADGTPISKVDMYYNIFASGHDKPYVFTPAMYELIDSDMTDIPYNFTDGGYDFSVSGTRHTVVIYEELGVVGVQSVNVAGDKTFRSDIVWTDGQVSGIGSVAADSEADAVIYDLTGRRVDNPATGIYIRRQGNTTSKVVIR